MSPASQLNWLGTHGDDRPVIDPATHVREMAARRGDNAGTACPELVLASFRSFMVDPLIKATGASPASFHARVSLGLLAARPVAVARFEIGAPASVMLFEELIGLGARTLLLAGATGQVFAESRVAFLCDPHTCQVDKFPYVLGQRGFLGPIQSQCFEESSWRRGKGHLA